MQKEQRATEHKVTQLRQNCSSHDHTIYLTTSERDALYLVIGNLCKNVDGASSVNEIKFIQPESSMAQKGKA